MQVESPMILNSIYITPWTSTLNKQVSITYGVATSNQTTTATIVFFYAAPHYLTDPACQRAWDTDIHRLRDSTAVSGRSVFSLLIPLVSHGGELDWISNICCFLYRNVQDLWGAPETNESSQPLHHLRHQRPLQVHRQPLWPQLPCVSSMESLIVLV